MQELKNAPIIGLTGPAGCGKDYIAQKYYINRRGYTRLAFGDIIKEMLATLLEAIGHDPFVMFNRNQKEQVLSNLGKSPRELMQTLGTEWGRNTIHPDLWVIALKSELDATPGPVVITDVRFENEADFVRKNGGTVIHIKRENSGIETTHASEQGIAFVDGDEIYINNE